MSQGITYDAIDVCMLVHGFINGIRFKVYGVRFTVYGTLYNVILNSLAVDLIP